MMVALVLICAPVGMATAQTLKIGYSPDWAPYSVTTDGATQGILPSLLDEIITGHLGVPLEHVGLPWKRVQSLVKSGTLDALITFPSEDRLEYAERSENVVYDLEYRAFVRKGSKTDVALTANPGIDILKNYSGCVIFGNDWAKTFYATHAIPYQNAVDVKNCLRLLDRDRVDFMIQATAVGLDNIRQLNLQETIVPLPQTYTRVPFVLLISKSSGFHKTFMPRFDAVVTRMKEDGTLQTLIDRLHTGPAS